MEAIYPAMQYDILELVVALHGVPPLLQREQALLEPLPVHLPPPDKASCVAHEHAVEARVEEVHRPWRVMQAAQVRWCCDVRRGEERRKLVRKPLRRCT